MKDPMPAKLAWKKQRPSQDMMTRLEHIARDLERDSRGRLHLVKQPFGKLITCRSGELMFFHVGDGGKPPTLLTIAVTTDPHYRTLLPGERPEDFEECCDRLGFHTEEQRCRFQEFLAPRISPKKAGVGVNR